MLLVASGCVALGESMGLDMDGAVGARGYMGPRFDALTAPEQDVFRRCRPQTYRAMCGVDRAATYASICVKDQGEKYAELAGERDRKVWLLERGCPLSMVDPAAALGGR